MKGIDEILSGKCLLRFRGELMGIAMLWVMLFHCYTRTAKTLNLHILYAVLKRGNLGVDMFLVLSGMGLYYSLSRNNQTIRFYWRRIIRVVIPWLILSCPYWIVKSILVDHDGVGTFLLNWTGLSFWIMGTTTVWYIAFIVVLYALYPLIFHFQKYSRYALPLLIGISIALNVALLILCPEYYAEIEIALSRVPVFLLGSYIGESIYHSNKLIRNNKVLLYLAGLLLLYVWQALSKTPYFPALPTSVAILMKRLGGQIVAYFVIMLSCLFLVSFEAVSVKKFLAFIGALTLEEYLIHVFINNIFHKSGITGRLPLPARALLMAFVITTTILASYIFSRIYGRVIRNLEGRRE